MQIFYQELISENILLGADEDIRIYTNYCSFSYLVTLLFQIGSFFMINLCLVVIATQFSETKKRETAKMKAEREKFSSTSTLSTVESRFVCPRILLLAQL